MYLQCASRLREFAAIGFVSPHHVEFQAYQILFYACSAMSDWAAQPDAGYDGGHRSVNAVSSSHGRRPGSTDGSAPAWNNSISPAVYTVDAGDDAGVGATLQSIEIGQRNPTAVLLQAVRSQDLCHPTMVRDAHLPSSCCALLSRVEVSES